MKEMLFVRVDTWEEALHLDSKRGMDGLKVTCPVCGREFGCNKTYHVYTVLVGRKR